MHKSSKGSKYHSDSTANCRSVMLKIRDCISATFFVGDHFRRCIEIYFDKSTTAL